MSTHASNLKLGAFVILAAGILVAALMAFGLRGYFEKNTLFETYVAGDVDGLSIGSPVKLRGVPVGRVTRINFTWNTYGAQDSRYVLVEFEVKSGITAMIPTKSFAETVEHEIGQGLRARVRSQGITGTSFVSLEYLNPSFNPPLKVKWTPNHYYIPSAEGQFSQMLASIEKTLQNLEKLDLAALGDLLGKDLVSARDLITKLENLDFQAVLTNANGLVTDIRESNQRLQTLLDDTRNKVKALDVAGLNDRGEKLLTGLAETGEKIGRTVEQVDVSSLKQTLDSARQATERLDDVLRDLKEYPSGFLFGRPPSPARSLDSKRR